MEGVVRERSARELGAAIAAGRVDARELTAALLDHIAAVDGDRAVYLVRTEERAMREAAAAHDRARRGMTASPLDGVPVSWKDLYDTAGITTSHGSALLRDRVPEHDCPLVARGVRAGWVMPGKTNQSEFAFSGLGLNPTFGTPANPYSGAEPLAPGGSSSGAAVSVAAGLAAIAMGSDTGGSVRVPAAWCGVTGLKTTWNTLPMDGVLPLAPSLDTAGPLARDVADAALAWATLARRPAPDLAGASMKGVRLLVPRTLVWDDCELGIDRVVREALDRLAKAGATLVEADVPEFAESDRIIARGPYLPSAEGYAVWGDLVESAPERVFSQIVERFRLGAKASPIDLAKLILEGRRLQASYVARTAGFDAAVMPTVPISAPPVARLLADEPYYIERNLKALSNTRYGNYLGLSGLTVPCGTDDAGVPVGLMLLGAPHAEARLLRLGAGVERALGA